MTTTYQMRRLGIEPRTYCISNHGDHAGMRHAAPFCQAEQPTYPPEADPKAPSKWQPNGNRPAPA